MTNYQWAEMFLESKNEIAAPYAAMALIDKLTEFENSLQMFHDQMWYLQMRNEQMR